MWSGWLKLVPYVGVLAGTALVLGVAPVRAQSGDGRCEWTDCAAAGNSGGGAGLPECSDEDRGACGDACRSEFDQEHFRCIDRCLAKRCRAVSEPSPGQVVDPPTEWESELCLEGESAACEGECRERPDQNQPRCRLACLSRVCPRSRKSDVAQEAAKPGYVACQRCRAREERECRRLCGVGASIRPDRVLNGLGSYACEKSCIVGACGGNCAF